VDPALELQHYAFLLRLLAFILMALSDRRVRLSAETSAQVATKRMG
jgi:hypothetical protein